MKGLQSKDITDRTFLQNGQVSPAAIEAVKGDLRTHHTLLDGGLTTTNIATAAKSGKDTTLITGTKGTSGNLASWNADGDMVDAGIAYVAPTSLAPVFSGSSTAGTINLSTGVGVYYKIGKMVTYTFTAIVSSVSGSPAGVVQVALPSTSKNTANNYWHGTARVAGVSWGAGATMCEWVIINNYSVAWLLGYTNNAAQTNSDASTIGAGDTLGGTITYEEA